MKSLSLMRFPSSKRNIKRKWKRLRFRSRRQSNTEIVPAEMPSEAERWPRRVRKTLRQLPHLRNSWSCVLKKNVNNILIAKERENSLYIKVRLLKSGGGKSYSILFLLIGNEKITMNRLWKCKSYGGVRCWLLILPVISKSYHLSVAHQ